MPLIDGVEVFSDEKAARKIQTGINAVPDLKQDLKTDIETSKINLDADNSQYNGSDYSIFFDEQEYGEGNALNNRKDSYDTFKEMDTMEFIHRGIEIISDDSTQPNSDGDVMKFVSDDETLKLALEDLFLKKLDMNNELWSIFYETVKMGDNFYEVIPDDYKKPKEIKRVRYLEPDKVERIEKDGKLSHFSYKVVKKDKKTSSVTETAEYKLFPWQIIHFKIENKSHDPYGGSLLEAGVRTYRRLVMLEDLMLVYRISRAPERRVFYIDVGNLNAVEAKRFLMKMKDSYRSQSFLDEAGRINKKANVMSITSDIFVPVKEGSQGTRIETLQGGTSMGTGSEDPLLSYFKTKILRTMNIPSTYMGEGADNSRNLSTIDQKFARFIERVQAQIIQGVNKLAALELFFKGYKKEDLNNFTIELTPPSNVKEITEIELINQRMTLIGTIQQLNLFPNDWILKNILKMSDKEVADIALQKKLEGNEAGGAEGAMGGGGGELPPMDMGTPPEGGEPPVGEAEGGEPPVGEAPPEGENPPEAPPEELAASTLVSMFGKDFLIENKDDFFNLVKKSKDYNTRNPLIPMFESASDFITGRLETSNNKVNRNNIIAMLSMNEFKGINFNERKLKMWEKDENGTKEELNEVIIECGIKSLNS